ncbi:hypothetical protein FE782_21940 [Paenibacillus antri]|uniref:Uncharacterized protein n=1 Tax=Paenibacillus antri TaxID=2582848 RepID=A0A5R9G100_9BACL|nr:hypothetical protein [Paenibacillus antri]TLS50002.1 hypothetical protein FE782_21940 [Paenibacillus antri]
MHDQMLRNYVLGTVEPVVRYGLYEMKYTSVAHSMFEISAITFLMGRGYDFPNARRIVESWEVNESFPPYQITPGF